ncbi:MAG: TolC family outer membrane protein [Methylobacter sp.]
MTKTQIKKLVYFIATVLTGISPLKAQNLSETLTLALQNNPALHQAQARLSAVAETKDQSIARLLPSVYATSASSREYLHNIKAKTRSDYRGTDVNQEYWNHTFNVNLTQPLFRWEYWIELSQSDNEIAKSEALYQAELQNLMAKTAEYYFNVLAAKDALDVVQAEKQAITQQLEQAKQRFEAGFVAMTDVYDAQAAFDQAVTSEIEAGNQLDNQKDLLREIIGNNDVRLNALGEQLPLLKPVPADMSAWNQLAQGNNMSIVSAINQAEVARKSIELKRSGHLPSLDLVAAYGVSDNSSSFGLRGDGRSVGLQLNVPLFEGGMVNSKTRQAVFEYEAAKENLNASRLTVERQVNYAYRGLMTSISRVESLSSAIISAQKALEANEVGFDAGTRTMVDVLITQKNLFRAKRDFSRARYDYLIYSIKLKQASSDLTQNDLEQINRLLMAKSFD